MDKHYADITNTKIISISVVSVLMTLLICITVLGAECINRPVKCQDSVKLVTEGFYKECSVGAEVETETVSTEAVLVKCVCKKEEN